MPARPEPHRSARPDDPAELPSLSFLMPVLNERDYVEQALESVLRQVYPAPVEVVVALGPSTDGTDAIVHECSRRDPRIRVVEVDRAMIPVGMNAALAAARYPIVARVDAHTELPPGYAERAVRTLLARDAATVGGIMTAVGTGGFQLAVAAAYNSRWGLGGGAYHLADTEPGESESAYLGVMRAADVAAVGGYDETIGRGEDWELNHRLRLSGRGVWLDPALRVEYYPRASAGQLAQQMWATGAWRAELVRRLGAANSRRYFAPPALVASAGALVLATAARVLGLRSPGLRRLARAAAVAPAAHVAVVAAVAARQPGPTRHRLRFAGVLAIMHYAWGGGFLFGLARGADRVQDRSRVRPVERVAAGSTAGAL